MRITLACLSLVAGARARHSSNRLPRRIGLTATGVSLQATSFCPSASVVVDPAS